MSISSLGHLFTFRVEELFLNARPQPLHVSLTPKALHTLAGITLQQGQQDYPHGLDQSDPSWGQDQEEGSRYLNKIEGLLRKRKCKAVGEADKTVRATVIQAWYVWPLSLDILRNKSIMMEFQVMY